MINAALPIASHSHLNSLAHAYQPPLASAKLRCEPEDFEVQETLSFQPSGTGNHVYLYVQKRLLTTEELSRNIAKVAKVSARHIGYAGLKDRNALTRQWFSVDLAGKAPPDWQQLESDRIKLIAVTRHERKLKQGAIRCNGFRLTLREVCSDREWLNERLGLIKSRGVPNYFAGQRFGIEENNLTMAQQLLAGQLNIKNRHLRGLYYSAARSYLFNRVLSYRVILNAWDRALAGEAMILNGSRSFFVVDEINEDIVRRLQQGDIHPSGPLWGKGEPAARAEARTLELQALQDCAAWRQGLEEHGLEQQRRALRLLVSELSWEFENEDVLHLAFKLPSGAYATSVVRELADIE